MFIIPKKSNVNIYDIEELIIKIEKCLPGSNVNFFRKWLESESNNCSFECLDFIYQAINMSSCEWKNYFDKLSNTFQSINFQDIFDYGFIMFYLNCSLVARYLVNDDKNCLIISSCINYLEDMYDIKINDEQNKKS